MCEVFEKDYCLSCKYVLRHKVNAEKKHFKKPVHSAKWAQAQLLKVNLDFYLALTFSVINFLIKYKKGSCQVQ